MSSIPPPRVAPSILVIDDHPVVADSVAALVRSLVRDAVIQQAHGLKAALAHAQRDRHFDLLVIDLSLPDSRGITTFETLKGAWPLADIVVFTGVEHALLRLQCLQGGALAFVTKSEDVQALKQAVGQALNVATSFESAQPGGSLTDAHPGAHAKPRFELTPKQQVIWQDVAAGYSNAEIGQRHDIALNTVKTHVREILERVGARNRTEAARRYFELH
jgi:DNA-binding NarL/FixJ family response regulator